MCSPTEDRKSADSTGGMASNKALSGIIVFCGVVTVAAVASAVALSFKNANTSGGGAGPNAYGAVAQQATIVINTADIKYATGKPPAGDNVCEGKKPDLPNVDCIIDAMVNVGPQAGANVTNGYKGGLEVDHVPITTPYWQNSMCPVNVHWHLGAEHYSKGQFDENGVGPIRADLLQNLDRRLEAEPEEGRQLQVTAQTRMGYQCQYYDAEDEKFTAPYVWKHCVGMEIGETYEVHWPHSAAGQCGTPNQYQTPFYDGVFCTDGVLKDTAAQIGVQAQVFTIVNDEAYYYGDLMQGMIVDGEFGADIAMYTGSTTGTSRDNEICSQYSPITWQVDRKCHLISASSFDKMCADMKAQRDDMTDDLHPHGSREVVAPELTANNMVAGSLSGGRASVP